MDDRNVTTGDVLVFRGRPIDENPYKFANDRNYVHGGERAAALALFAAGGGITAGYSFWFAPAEGGCRELHRPEWVEK